MDDFKRFLAKARRETYAIPHGQPLGDGMEVMSYDAHGWSYRDRYAGQNPYGGHELVWRGENIVWMKNYMAEVLAEAPCMTDIYAFQREVLGQPDPDHLMRGPKRYDSGPFSYANRIEGDIGRFQGEEVILYEGETVYRMILHGGFLR